ncbi:N-acetylmuramic acid 6-phosphate etherase [Solicola gregarius]|uniref:N-acetylmuramic acid 6-phosphate etherase n=1 Tax=Solicola gregarius TaxID=2908642 RepID=A0AA46YIS5_9ACTN|nr:N-acetylmuramic acid 6-phosphate etherase [Solicola gregarius]UYM03465.1 N-acetylmuramic acid 6-phosphate etherase [Solicola gregarius]
MAESPCVVGVDVGRSRCRVVVLQADERAEWSGRGVVPTPGPTGVRVAAAGVRTAIRHALETTGRDRVAPSAIAVGMAGVTTLDGGTVALAAAMSEQWPGARVAAATDAVTAHAGALAGAPGAVLAVGTGAIALGLASDGSVHRADGWGQWLGDDGSGTWIGREALRAVVRAQDGRGPATSLSRAAVRRFGDFSGLAAALPFESILPTRTAEFVPDVVAAADAGDDAATEILRRAADAWAESALAAARAADVDTVTCVGGLAEVPTLYELWRQGVASDLKVLPAAGSSLDGAVLIAQRDDLPHEEQVARRLSVGSSASRAEDLDVLATEGVRPALDDLDVRDAGELVDVLLDAEGKLPHVLSGARDAIAEAVGAIETAFHRGGRLLYVGAGTPGRLAALDAAECPPTFGTPPERVVAILAGGTDASTAAIEGAEDRTDDAAAALAAHDVGRDDVVVGISASGRTPFVLAALEFARTSGAATVAVVNNSDSVIAAAADVAVELLTGAEVISGSTRLTAGTAQKVTLNTLSTAAMIRLGKTYGPRMVDVVASNHKLRRRAARIVREICDVDDATAVVALEGAGWQTKTAIVALLAGVGSEEARARLAAGDGRVRSALEAEPPQ